MLLVTRVVFVLSCLLMSGCYQQLTPRKVDIQLNDIQTIGTHNSYKQFMPDEELKLIALYDEQLAQTLNYGFESLPNQLHAGMRQLEIDVYHDPEGGRYRQPLIRKILGHKGPLTNDQLMAEPGFKVLHIQDIDYRSSCYSFEACLLQLRAWSDSHPRHIPILVLINAKEKAIKFEDATVPFEFTPEVFDLLDREIADVFPEEKLITPDQVRGEYSTLREAVIDRGWLNLEQSRGKVFFALDADRQQKQQYLAGHEGLKGRLMFVSVDIDHAGAAFMIKNNSIRDQQQIADWVRQGFVIRTRADSETVEARNNDYSRLQAALASGAQYISTDYYHANMNFSSYEVGLPDDVTVRCNPQRSASGCQSVSE